MGKIPITGTEYANRLLDNIQTSIKLRQEKAALFELLSINPLASIKDVTTSSNFMDLDNALRDVLSILAASNNRILRAPDTRPLPLQAIYDNLSDNIATVSDLLKDYLTGKEAAIMINQSTSALILLRLDMIATATI